MEGEDVVGGFEFGDGYEADFAAGAGGLDALVDGGKVRGELFRALGVDAHFV